MTGGLVHATPASDTWQHVGALDGLRALAVIAVLLFHAGHLQGGFLGVDLFFALSGFLITSLLLRDATGGGIVLWTFWGRRFRRLLPAVFVMIAAVTSWVWAFGTPAELDGVRRDGLWALAYLANWHLIFESAGYWASFAQPSVFDHLWSLAVEEQFYVIWPLAVLAVWRRARRPQQTLVIVTSAAIVASFLLMLVLYDPMGDPTRVYMGTDTRASSILVGALLATAPARRVASTAIARLGRGLDVVIALLGAIVLWSWFAIDGASSSALYRGGLLLHSIVCAVVVVAMVTADRSRSARVLSWAPLVLVGVRSYGLYLWHWPVYVIMSEDRMGFEGPGLTATRLTVTVALTELSFRLVEGPIRYRVTWARGRRGLRVLAASVVVVAAILVLVPQPERDIAAFDPSTVVVPAATSTTEPPAPSTTTTPATSDPAAAPSTTASAPASTISSTSSSTTSSTTSSTVPAPRPVATQVLWTGDSIAYDAAPAVIAALSDAGVPTSSTAFPGLRLVGDDRLSLGPRLPGELEASDADVLVLQISVWDAGADEEELRQALEDIHTIATDAGTTVVFVPAPPTDDDDANALMAAVTERAAELAAEYPATTFLLDPTPVWGTTFDEDLDDDGVPERKRDGVHICPSGAARFAAWLTAALAERFDGFTPTPPEQWATGDWVTDERYDLPVGSCAPIT